MVCNCDLKRPHIPANGFVALGECKVRSPVGTSSAFNYWWKNHYFTTSVNYFLSCLKLERSKLDILARTMEMHTGIECSISEHLWRAKDYGRRGGTDINTTQSSPSSNTTPCVYLRFLLCLWTEKTFQPTPFLGSDERSLIFYLWFVCSPALLFQDKLKGFLLYKHFPEHSCLCALMGPFYPSTCYTLLYKLIYIYVKPIEHITDFR